MLTMNYYLHVYVKINSTLRAHVTSDGGTRVMNYAALQMDDAMAVVCKSTLDCGGVCFCTGDVNPSQDAYTIANPLLEEITVSAPSSHVVGVNNGCLEMSGTYGILGIAESTTITGVGLFVRGTDQETSTQHNILMDITALDTPVTVKRGETKQITYTIRFNEPEA